MPKRAAHLHCDRQGEQAHVSDAKRAGSSKIDLLNLDNLRPV